MHLQVIFTSGLLPSIRFDLHSYLILSDMAYLFISHFLLISMLLMCMGKCKWHSGSCSFILSIHFSPRVRVATIDLAFCQTRGFFLATNLTAENLNHSLPVGLFETDTREITLHLVSFFTITSPIISYVTSPQSTLTVLVNRKRSCSQLVATYILKKRD